MMDVISIVGLVLFSPFIVASMLLNNADLKAFKRGFGTIVHPPASASLAISSRVGNLGCASNHCDFFVGNLRASPLPQDALLAHYTGMTIPAPFDRTIFGESTEVQIWFFDDEVPECAPAVDGLFNRQQDWGVDLSAHSGRTIYMVYAEEAGAPPGADIRCH